MSRARFILLATASYLVLGLAWIYLSDRLMIAIIDREMLLALSESKGTFFVLASAAGLFFALRAVPPPSGAQTEPMLNALARTTAPNWRWRLLMYLFAVSVTLAMLLIRRHLQVGLSERLMLILYMLPIVLSALMGGLGPGLVATCTAALGVDAMMIPHLHDPATPSHDQFQWAVLMINGLAVSLLSEMLRSSLAKLEGSRYLLDAVVSGTSDAVFVKDGKGRYLLVNAAAAAFVDKPITDILGKDDSALFDPTSTEELARLDLAIMTRAQVQTHEEVVTTQAGRAHVFQVTKGPVFDTHGNVNGLFGISRDITDQKQAFMQMRASEERLQRVVDATTDGFWDWDVESGHVYRSPNYYAVIGARPEDDSGGIDFFKRYIHPADFDHVMQTIDAHRIGALDAIEVDFRLAGQAEPPRWMRANGRAVSRDARGRATRLVGTISDVTDRKRDELAQREASVVFESSYEGIMVVSPDRLITKVNPAFTRITGYAEGDVVGRSPAILSSGQHGAPFYREMWSSLQQHDFWRGEIWNRRKCGEVFAELLAISVVRDTQGLVQHYIGVFSDISHLKTHEAELDRVAHYDALTGLPNRRLLSDRLNQSIIRSTRSGKSSAVCFLDLDGFKTINDQHGHSVGDSLLIGVTEHLKSVLRSDDTLARLGGDEFVIILSEIASPEECTLILDRILAAASATVSVEGLSITASASVGVSLYPEDNADADTLLRHADQAMYLAKEAGKNRYQLFDPESDRKAQTRRKFLELLHQALVQQEFVLFYQPKVDLANGDVVGVEALIRWQHPQRGLLAPAEFLPYIHGSELERAFGEWVIHTALSQASAWNALGLEVKISVNVSANHLLQESFCEHLDRALRQHPSVPPGQLELEVLESAAIGDIQHAVSILKRCRALGVKFSLDDFGTGYSSLTYLRKLPVDTLKIDQSFVRDMLTDADDLGIVEGVIKLASVFNRQVIAEGVETMEHGAMLRRLGCNLVQGYGIARPMPAERFPYWREEWANKTAWLEMGPAAEYTVKAGGPAV